MNFVKVYQMKLHDKFDSPGPFGSGQKDIVNFHSINLCKTCDPWGRPNFYPKGYNLKIFFHRGPLDDAAS